MKRAKIMLTAIVVLAGVGGALAFKAQKFSQANIYCKFAGDQTCKKVNYTTQFVFDALSTTNPCKGAETTSTYTTSLCGTPLATTTGYVTIE